jgi:hypothetical protein
MDMATATQPSIDQAADARTGHRFVADAAFTTVSMHAWPCGPGDQPPCYQALLDAAADAW